MLLSWLRSVDPQILKQYATEWEQIGTGLEGVYQKYVDAVSQVNGQYWEGQAANAAHDRASGDLKTVKALVDKLNGMAGQARTGASQISEALRKARGLLDECHNKGWSVTEMLAVVGSGDVRALAQMNKDLTAAYNAVVAADLAVYDALQLTRSALSVSFTSGASLGGEQGKGDGKQLVVDPSHMTDAEIQRLIAAGTLTDDQLTDLHNGKTVTIPTSQMDYINQLARSLDDKSPEEIQAIMDKLPPNAQKALENSLQIISNSNVTTAAKGDPGIPEQGGAKLLPAKMEQSLTRSDLVVQGMDNVGGPTGGLLQNTIKFNGVADNQSIAKIAGGSDPRYRAGSDLDKQVLDVSAKYLNGQTTWEQSGNRDDIMVTIDGHGGDPRAALTENMFSAVSDDKAAVQNLVIDASGKPNEQFFHDALTHHWTDDNKAASSLFEFGNYDSHSVDGQRQASIMSAFGQFAAGDNVPGFTAGGDDKWKLYDIPGTDHQNVGQLNPKLVQTLSTSMTPFINDLTSGTQPTGDGFKVTDSNGVSWTDPSGKDTFSGSKSIFALFDTNDDAGKSFNAAALANALHQEAEFGQAPNAPDAKTHLYNAGQLNGLVDAGLRDEISSHAKDIDAINADAYKDKKNAYGMITKGLGYSLPLGDTTLKTVTGEQISKMFAVGGDPVQDAVIGKAPSTSNTDIGLNPPNYHREAYNVLTEANIPDNLREKYPRLFDDHGDLKSWQAIQSTPYQPTSTGGQDTNPMGDITHLLDDIGSGRSEIKDGYDAITTPNRANDGQAPHNK